MIIVAALLLLGGGGGAAAWWFGLIGGSSGGEPPVEGDPEAASAGEATSGHGAVDEHGSPAAETEAGHGSGGGEGHGAAGVGVAFVDLPDVVVNLQSTGTRMRFLKLRISLEVAGDQVAEQLRVLTPRVMDSFQLYLRALTVDDIQGASGMQRLKEEMLLRVATAVEPLKVEDVLIKEMLVQ